MRATVIREQLKTPRSGAIAGLLFSIMIAICLAGKSHAQDLTPRAYLITPVHSNAVVTSYSFLTGNLAFNNAVPITDATATGNIASFTYAHAMKIFGRSSSINATLPYGVANFSGELFAKETNVYRSGLLDTTYRFAINLYGGPAMDAREFAKWRQKTVIGASLRVDAPTGQYDGTKLVNFGANRWGFKPEVGVSRRWGHWIVDGYAGGWFYTINPEYFSKNQYNPGVTSQSSAPIVAFEGHLSYSFRPRLWASLDGNYWRGGTTSLNGVENPNTLQNNSRIGGTFAMPVTKHQTLKCSYANGAYIKYGGNYQALSVGWQYSWIGRPE